jgi:hypothetical protein
VNWNELEPLFVKLVRSPLRRLALTSFASGTSLLETLRRTGLPPTLRTLDLSDSALRREHVLWMRDNKALFAPLAELVLERTGVEPSAIRELEGLGLVIAHSPSSDAPTWRYVVGSE